MEPNIEQLKNRFMYHAPQNEGEVNLHEAVNSETFALACTLSELLPEGRQLSLVLTKLEEVRMWANAALAQNK